MVKPQAVIAIQPLRDLVQDYFKFEQKKSHRDAAILWLQKFFHPGCKISKQLDHSAMARCKVERLNVEDST